uniref:Uncharacterized protein n=1 Tax=Oryza glumipatula TaxID=40148 RepID=A0A0E0AYJ6_9ORYZ
MASPSKRGPYAPRGPDGALPFLLRWWGKEGCEVAVTATSANSAPPLAQPLENHGTDLKVSGLLLESCNSDGLVRTEEPKYW